MRFHSIDNFSIANGPGVRVSLYVSGCSHHCKNCFNPETWAFDSGQPYTEETQHYLESCLGLPQIAGLTVVGGDPMEPCTQEDLLKCLESVKKKRPDKDIWVYTGYLWEDLISGKAHTEYTDKLLSLTDVLVDGPYKEEEHNYTLKFRGSSNQRIIDVKQSLEKGGIVLVSFVH